jgi:hypothetical protein
VESLDNVTIMSQLEKGQRREEQQDAPQVARRKKKTLVGARGFEPRTPCAQVLVARRINTLAQFGCVQIRSQICGVQHFAPPPNSTHPNGHWAQFWAQSDSAALGHWRQSKIGQLGVKLPGVASAQKLSKVGWCAGSSDAFSSFRFGKKF